MPYPPILTSSPLHRRVATRAAPLDIFRRLYADQPHAFLYESLEAHGQRGRYSFLGGNPAALLTAKRRQCILRTAHDTLTFDADPLDVLRQLVQQRDDAPPVAPFCGGAVGYLAYDIVRLGERLPEHAADPLALPDVQMMIPSEVICFDHLQQTAHVILYDAADRPARFEQLCSLLRTADADVQAGPRGPTPRPHAAPPAPGIHTAAQPLPIPPSNLSQAQFEQNVRRAQEYIRAGDIFQVVLSQRFEFEVDRSPLDYYTALRSTNPSPYMYFVRFGDLAIAGSSPEVLVSLSGRRVVTRPLAGTRPRGQSPAEDLALAEELRCDEKERAEHVMLVDLGRNDLGRVCQQGSVRVLDVMDIEYHSRVMHLVSYVEGWLREDRDAIDVLRAAFPAGTVSGAPKVRAMEIIDELEPVQRGVYAGAIGYLSFQGDMDLCIAIRTMVLSGKRGYIQAGAGIVADSDPGREYQETINKASALFRALARKYL